jgi:hypothetical protein
VQRRKPASLTVATPSPRDIRNSIRSFAMLYSPSVEAANQGLLDLGLDPALEKPRARASIEGRSVARPVRTESVRSGGELIIDEHTIQSSIYGLLQRDKRVAWVSRYNSGKFKLQGSPGSPGGPTRWFSANTKPGHSDLLGCLVSDGTDARGRIIPGRVFALEVKERSLSARRAVASVIAAVDAGTFDPFEESGEKGRIASQYSFLLEVRRGGGIGEFVFDVDEAMRLLL